MRGFAGKEVEEQIAKLALAESGEKASLATQLEEFERGKILPICVSGCSTTDISVV